MRSKKPADRDDHDQVYRLVLAGWGAQAIRTLAALSVAEHLDEHSLTAHQIAERTSSDPDMTYRVLRAGVALGFLQYEGAATTFTGTPRLEILHADSPFTLKHFAQTAPGPAFWPPLMRLTETVRRGSNYVEEMLGGDVWNFFAEHEDEARIFRSAMTDLSTPVIREAVAVIGDVDGEFVIDVGGANGAFVGQLLQRNSRLNGAVLDLSQAMAGVAETANLLGLSDRMTGIAGDFLDSVPAADLYLLKFILHDWNDESCIKILSAIRHSMKPKETSALHRRDGDCRSRRPCDLVERSSHGHHDAWRFHWQRTRHVGIRNTFARSGLGRGSYHAATPALSGHRGASALRSFSGYSVTVAAVVMAKAGVSSAARSIAA